jgi:hypothetical protein
MKDLMHLNSTAMKIGKLILMFYCCLSGEQGARYVVQLCVDVVN